MGKKFIFTAVFISFSILGVAQIPVLSIKKNIFKITLQHHEKIPKKPFHFLIVREYFGTVGYNNVAIFFCPF